MAEPIKVTVTDPDTGEVLGEQLLDDDYAVICAGSRYVAHTTAHANGTHIITVKRAPADATASPRPRATWSEELEADEEARRAAVGLAPLRPPAERSETDQDPNR